MKETHAQGTFVVLAGLLLLVSSSLAQAQEQPVHNGLVQDWTQKHILFSRDAILKHPSLVASEPRIAHRILQRSLRAQPQLAGVTPSTGGPPSQHDWNVSLGLGRIASDMFPAKYSFDPSVAPDCVKDYVVFGLNHAAVTGAQANLVAFNNLYSGTSPAGLCGSAPTVLFAYDTTTVTAGRILNSPSLSLDGKKIAFVESGSATAVFHVLTWTAGTGGISSAADPGAAMVSIPFAAVLDTRSSPWVDYNTDTAYVGADDGKVYKFTGVFKGTPTLVSTAPWPVTLNAGVRVSSPVLDKNLGLLMVGIQNGTYYSINTTTGAVKALVVGKSGSTNPGILAAPIVDVTNGTSFVVSANDNTSGVLVEVNSALMTQLAKGRIGLASKSTTAISLFQPAFSDSYFDDPTTGIARVCGTGAADTTPWQYAFGGFTLQSGKYVMNTTPVSSSQLLTSPNARCTEFTEFFNPNVGVGGTDYFFFGLTADCSGLGTSGCVVARNKDGSLTMADVAGGPSGIVVDNFSTAAQAASIYMTNQTAPNLAYKFTQQGLQ